MLCLRWCDLGGKQRNCGAMPNFFSMRRDRFWRFHWMGRASKLAAASSAGGAWGGAIIGLSNGLATQDFTNEPLWRWITMTAFFNAVWMASFGFVVGVPLFIGVAVASARWSARRKRSFGRQLTLRVCLPLCGCLIGASLAVSALHSLKWLGRSDLGDILVQTELATLGVGSVFFTGLLALTSRRFGRSTPKGSSRLLPLS